MGSVYLVNLAPLAENKLENRSTCTFQSIDGEQIVTKRAPISTILPTRSGNRQSSYAFDSYLIYRFLFNYRFLKNYEMISYLNDTLSAFKFNTVNINSHCHKKLNDNVNIVLNNPIKFSILNP